MGDKGKTLVCLSVCLSVCLLPPRAEEPKRETHLHLLGIRKERSAKERRSSSAPFAPAFALKSNESNPRAQFNGTQKERKKKRKEHTQGKTRTESSFIHSRTLT